MSERERYEGEYRFRERDLNAAMERDLALARERKHQGRIGKRARLRMQIDTAAVMNAVDVEGREVLTPAGEEYWRDMRRRHPHVDVCRDEREGRMRNRFGRVKERWVWDKGQECMRRVG